MRHHVLQLEIRAVIAVEDDNGKVMQITSADRIVPEAGFEMTLGAVAVAIVADATR